MWSESDYSTQISYVDPDPHGSALWDSSWIWIRMEDTDPQLRCRISPKMCQKRAESLKKETKKRIFTVIKYCNTFKTNIIVSSSLCIQFFGLSGNFSPLESDL